MAHFIPLETGLFNSGFKYIAGIDEAGRGPLAGPVVSAAVILNPDKPVLKINDSKKLTAPERDSIFEKIIKNAIDYAISIVSHEMIDEVGILNAVRIANQNCLKQLKYTPEIVLIDGCDRQILNLPFRTVIKGDSKVRCIAAASILAKVTRDRIMQEFHCEFKEYKFNEHFGYGTRAHREILEKSGPCPIHRKSYTLVDTKQQLPF